MVRHPDVDVVVVCVRVPKHHCIAMDALEAGKHVYTEWPLAANVAQVYSRFARAIRTGQRTEPDFETALRLHRLLATIDRASEESRHQVLT